MDHRRREDALLTIFAISPIGLKSHRISEDGTRGKQEKTQSVDGMIGQVSVIIQIVYFPYGHNK